MSPSICLACIVYTLEDKPVEENCYLNIFYMWLSKVIQNGGLTKDDIIHIHIDSRTFAYLENTHTVFPDIYATLPCQHRFIIIKSPKSSLEGMMNKYTHVDYTQDIYMYCDIDVLIINPFRIMTDTMKTNTLYVCGEGNLRDAYYSEGFSVSEDLVGFSAGKFAIYGKSLLEGLFKRIHEYCDYSTKYITVEQPYFNRAVYTLESPYTVDTKLLTHRVVFNGSSYYDTDAITIFFDLAGNAGDGITHLKKIMDTISLFACGHYKDYNKVSICKHDI